MKYETIGKLIFGQQRLQMELGFVTAAGAAPTGAEWDALLADVAAVDLAVEELQRNPASFDIEKASAALERCVRAGNALKRYRC